MSEKRFSLKVKKEYLLIAAAIAAISIVALSSSLKPKNITVATPQAEQSDTEKYVFSLESKLKNTISGIKGAGNVSVAISVKGDVKPIYATDVKTVQDGEKTVTTSTIATFGGKPLVIGSVYPEITGVAIVAGGADDITVKMAILDAVTTVLNVPCNKVRILAR